MSDTTDSTILLVGSICCSMLISIIAFLIWYFWPKPPNFYIDSTGIVVPYTSLPINVKKIAYIQYRNPNPTKKINLSFQGPLYSITDVHVENEFTIDQRDKGSQGLFDGVLFAN